MRKDRNVLTAFLLVLILTSLLLHTGLFVGQYSSIYDEKVKERKEADVLSYIVASDDDISKALSGIPEIAEFSIQDMVMPGTVKLRIEGEDEEFDLDWKEMNRQPVRRSISIRTMPKSTALKSAIRSTCTRPRREISTSP